jgi:hypothetical protein
MFLYLRSDATTESYTGDGSSGILAWGGQCEVGAFATSYIPTTTAAATRAADSAVISTLTPWFNAGEGTMVVRVVVPNLIGGQTFASIDTNATNRISLYNGSGTTGFMFVRNGGTTQAGLTTGTITVGSVYKLAGAYKADDFAASSNGATPVTDVSGTIPTVAKLYIGAYTLGNYCNGWVQGFTYYPTRLPNTQLQALTL